MKGVPITVTLKLVSTSRYLAHSLLLNPKNKSLHGVELGRVMPLLGQLVKASGGVALDCSASAWADLRTI